MPSRRGRRPVAASQAASGSLATVQLIYPRHSPAAVTDGELARLYAYPGGDRAWVRANMVASADGAVSVDGRSGGLAGPADRQLFRVLRSLADVVVVGSGTAVTEKYKPARPYPALAGLRDGRPPTPPIAVVSARLGLDPDSPLLTDAPASARTIVLTTTAAPRDRRAALARHATVIEAGTERVGGREAIAALAGLGHTRILTEGGPKLLGHIAAAGLLDELCLTVSPLLAGGHAGRILAGDPPGPPQPLALAHVLADDGYLFCRYLRTEEAQHGAAHQAGT
jgi:riboflavin biosynthesis pyrimidine reductase